MLRFRINLTLIEFPRALFQAHNSRPIESFIFILVGEANASIEVNLEKLQKDKRRTLRSKVSQSALFFVQHPYECGKLCNREFFDF